MAEGIEERPLRHRSLVAAPEPLPIWERLDSLPPPSRTRQRAAPVRWLRGALARARPVATRQLGCWRPQTWRRATVRLRPPVLHRTGPVMVNYFSALRAGNRNQLAVRWFAIVRYLQESGRGEPTHSAATRLAHSSPDRRLYRAW